MLERALEHIRRALASLDQNSAAARDLGVAQRLIEAAIHSARQGNAESAFDGDALHHLSSSEDWPPMPPLTVREEVLRRNYSGI